MEAVRVKMVVDSLSEPWTLWAIGDIHMGAPACDVDKLDETIKSVKEDPTARWIGMGDYIDCITHSDRKRFDPSEYKNSDIKVEDLSDLPRMQADAIIDKLRPIRQKCFALIEGNHEWHLPKFGAQDVMAYIAGSLGTPNLGPQGYIGIDVYYKKDLDEKGGKRRLSGPRYTVTVYGHHGYGGGRLAGSSALELQRQVMGAKADIYMFGHRHSSVIVPEYGTEMTRHDPPLVMKKPRINMMTSTYLKTFAQGYKTYAAKSGYRYTVLGSPYVSIWASNDNESDTRKRIMNVHMRASTPILDGGVL